MLAEDGRELKGKNFSKKQKGALPVNCKPELDTSEECNDSQASRFCQIKGILCWAIDLGQVDILIEITLIAIPSITKSWTP